MTETTINKNNSSKMALNIDEKSLNIQYQEHLNEKLEKCSQMAEQILNKALTFFFFF